MMSLLAAEAKYGRINNGAWGGEAEHCSLYAVPPLLAQTWMNTLTGLPTLRIYALNDMHQALDQALQLVLARGLSAQLKTFDGCFHIRDVRALPGTLSAHAYAGALDINAQTNPLGHPGDMSDELAECFTSQGFMWGKTFKRQDSMHFSWLGW